MAVDLSVLMPVFNERSTIETAVQRVLEADLGVEGWELVVVDDGSSDGTWELLAGRKWPDEVRIYRHERNQGKGAAVRTALAEAAGAHAAVLDADLEYDPNDLAALVRPLVTGEARAVFGPRSFASHSAYSFWYVVGNKAVTLAANVLYNAWISDLMTCHKAAGVELLRSLDLRERGFAIEAEITARLLRAGVRIYEVPASYNARSRSEGKKLSPWDGVRVLATLLRCRLG